MDRNQVIGFSLIAVMLILYFQFFSEAPPAEPQATDSLTQVETPRAIEPQAPQETLVPMGEDSTATAEREDRFGVFAPLATGEAETITLENDLLKVHISTRGGVFENVELKKYKSAFGDPVSLVDSKRSRIDWVLTDNTGRLIDLTDLTYKVASQDPSAGTLVLRGELGSGKSVEIKFSLPKDKYEVTHSIKLSGLESQITPLVNFKWNDRIHHQEKDVEISRSSASVNYFTTSGNFEETSERSTDLEEENVEEPVKWFSVRQKFFLAAIINQSSFDRGYVSTSVDLADTTTVKVAKVLASMPSAPFFSENGAGFTWYFGPKDYDILGDVTEGFDENLYLGWPPVSWVNKGIIIPLFNVLNSFIGNYGIIIIIMVLLIKLALSPLSYKSYLSMAKMKVLKPQLDELKEKNDAEGGDMSKLQQEQMKLYGQVGVNPLSGCVPMLLQMPILFAMFYFFPQSIELRQEGFLWADDLSTYDVIAYLPFHIPGYGDHVSLFVLLMTISTILYTWSNNQISTVQGPMKSISYIMPIIFLFVLNSFPAALSFYYFVSNLVTFAQQAIIRRFVDEDKILAILEENKKKNANKKKSTFVTKLEEAIKAGEQNQRKKKSGK